MLRSRVDEAAVDALKWLVDVEQTHVDPAERSSVMRERAVADGWTRNRSEPAVEYRKLQCQRGQHGQIFLREVIHDLLGVSDVLLLMEVALHESLHVGRATGRWVAAKDLQIDRRKMMVRIRLQLCLKLGERLRPDRIARRIRIAVGILRGDPVDLGIDRLQ